MTIREYIVSSLSGVSIPEADLVDTGLDLEGEYVAGMNLGKPMTDLVANLILQPRLRAVNESGFSMQYDTDHLGKYYIWLCKRYGIKPSPEILPLIGMSSIIDISDTW